MGSIWQDIKRLIGALDRWQRGHRIPAVAWAVQKKFGNDNAGVYTVALGWYGFTAIYPLLLLVVAIFGYLGVGTLGTGIVNTLHSFPIIGKEFTVSPSGSNRLHGSILGVIIGALGLLYGASGVTRTARQAMEAVWNIPQAERPNFFANLLPALEALGVIAGAFVLNAIVAGFATSNGRNFGVRAGIIIALFVLNSFLYLVEFQILTPTGIGNRQLWPGAVLGGVAFTLLITVGTGLIEHDLRNDASTYGNFGSIIGVVAFLLLLAKLSLYAAELNPVLHHRYYPRTLPTGDLTDADRRVFAAEVQTQRQRHNEDVDVDFRPPDDEGTTSTGSSARPSGGPAVTTERSGRSSTSGPTAAAASRSPSSDRASSSGRRGRQ